MKKTKGLFKGAASWPAAAALALLLWGPAACKKKAPAAPAPPPAAPAAPAAKPASPKAAAGGVAGSTGTVVVSTPAAPAPPRVPVPEDYYKAAGLRDPFLTLQGGAGAAVIVQKPVETVVDNGSGDEVDISSFDIHNLDLKGILNDPKGRMALLVDKTTRVSYILRGTRLVGAKNELIPGVTGKIFGQSVRLITIPDHDVQELRLGEQEGDEPQ